MLTNTHISLLETFSNKETINSNLELFKKFLKKNKANISSDEILEFLNFYQNNLDADFYDAIFDFSKEPFFKKGLYTEEEFFQIVKSLFVNYSFKYSDTKKSLIVKELNYNIIIKSKDNDKKEDKKKTQEAKEKLTEEYLEKVFGNNIFNNIVVNYLYRLNKSNIFKCLEKDKNLITNLSLLHVLTKFNFLQKLQLGLSKPQGLNIILEQINNLDIIGYTCLHYGALEDNYTLCTQLGLLNINPYIKGKDGLVASSLTENVHWKRFKTISNGIAIAAVVPISITAFAIPGVNILVEGFIIPGIIATFGGTAGAVFTRNFRADAFRDTRELLEVFELKYSLGKLALQEENLYEILDSENLEEVIDLIVQISQHHKLFNHEVVIQNYPIIQNLFSLNGLLEIIKAYKEQYDGTQDLYIKDKISALDKLIKYKPTKVTQNQEFIIQQTRMDGNCGFRAILGNDKLQGDFNRKGELRLLKEEIEKDSAFADLLRAYINIDLNGGNTNYTPSKEETVEYFKEFCKANKFWPHAQGILAAYASLLEGKKLSLWNKKDNEDVLIKSTEFMNQAWADKNPEAEVVNIVYNGINHFARLEMPADYKDNTIEMSKINIPADFIFKKKTSINNISNANSEEILPKASEATSPKAPAVLEEEKIFPNFPRESLKKLMDLNFFKKLIPVITDTIENGIPSDAQGKFSMARKYPLIILQALGFYTNYSNVYNKFFKKQENIDWTGLIKLGQELDPHLKKVNNYLLFVKENSTNMVFIVHLLNDTNFVDFLSDERIKELLQEIIESVGDKEIAASIQNVMDIIPKLKNTSNITQVGGEFLFHAINDSDKLQKLVLFINKFVLPFIIVPYNKC